MGGPAFKKKAQSFMRPSRSTPSGQAREGDVWGLGILDGEGGGDRTMANSCPEPLPSNNRQR